MRGLDYAGTLVFASSGSICAAAAGMDVLGAVAVGTITAVGGGTVRDVLILRREPFWAGRDGEREYLWMGALASIAAFFLYPSLHSAWPDDSWPDAVSLGAFACIGTMNGIRAGLAAPLCVLCGVSTGTFGGLTRDVLTRRPVRILHSTAELYATAAGAGAGGYLSAAAAGMPLSARIAAGIGSTVCVRYAAWSYGLRLPTWRSMGAGELVTGEK